MSWTLFEYRYRDAGNYKVNGSVALQGEATAAEADAATTTLESGEFFVAEQPGIPPPYEALYRYSSGSTFDDHCWHEFVAFTPIDDDRIAPDVLRLGPARAFLDRLEAVREWRCELSPHAGIGCEP